MLNPKQRAYDHYVTNGGGDVCFTYGMSGNCGPDCPEFGLRDGCEAEAQDYWKDEDEWPIKKI